MHAMLRPYAAAGVTIAGAGLIAATPLTGPLPDLQAHAVQLTSAWQDAFNATSENATTLLNNYYLAPNVASQQFFANQADYWEQLLNDPSNSTFAGITQELQEHLNAVISGYGLQNVGADTMATVLHHTIDYTHNLMFGQIGSYIPAGTDPDTVMPIINFLASPASAILMGALGPAISPWVALLNSITDHDSFGDTLANVSGAFFNGATLNLDSLLPMINGAGVFPIGMTMDHLDFAFGGLLSTGGVEVGPYEVLGPGGEVAASVPAVGGSLFQSVGLNFSGVPALGTLDLESHAIGPIAAWAAWGQILGTLLGSGWDGTGPIAVTPPLAGVDLPTVDDAALSSLATDAFGWLNDLLGL